MADTRIGGVYATFRAQNQPWLRASKQNVDALRRQGRATRTLRRDADRLRASVRGLVGGFAAFASGAGLALLARQSFQAGRSLSALGSTLVENSQRFGLTAEQIQLLGRAFEGGGASQEDFLKGFRNFNRNLVDAQAGLESYRRSFRFVGIDVDEAARQGLSAYEVFLQLADGLQQVENQSVRVNVAQTLLGRAGAALLFELQKGSEALRDNAEAFRSLGIITDDQAARLKALEQSYINTQNAIRTAQASIVADNAELFQAFNEFLAEQIPAFLEGVVNAIDAVRRNIDLVARGLALFVGYLVITGPVGAFVASVFRMVAAMGAFQLATARATAAFRFFRAVIGVGLIIEGVLLAVDAVAALRAESERTGRRMTQIFASAAVSIAASISAGLTEAITRFVTALLELPALVAGLVLDATLDDGRNRAQEFVAELQSLPDEISAVVRQSVTDLAPIGTEAGDEYIDAFIARVRARFSEFGEGGILPELAPPSDTAFVPDPPEDNAAAEEALRLSQFQVATSTELRRSLEDRVALAQQELDLLRQGATEGSAQRVVAEQLFELERRQTALAREREDAINAIRVANIQYNRAAQTGNAAVAAELDKILEGEREKLTLIERQIELNEAQRGTIERTAEAYGSQLEAITQSLEIAEIFQSTFDSAIRSVANFATQAITSFDNIGDAARALGRTIINSLLSALIEVAIRSALIGAFGTATLGIPFGAPAGFQRGGLAKGFAVVGEAGPELVDFNNPGRVYTTDDLATALGSGSGGANFVFAPVIESSDGPAVRRALLEAFPIFEERVLSRIQTDTQRPSSIRTAVRR